MRILSLFFILCFFVTPSKAGNEILADKTECSNYFPIVKKKLSPLGLEHFSKYLHSFRVVPGKYLHTREGFYIQYKKICPQCYDKGPYLHQAASRHHPKLFLHFVVLYNLHVRGIMENKWYTYIQNFFSDLQKMKISIKKLLIQLGSSINQPYALFLNDLWTATIHDFVWVKIVADPCALLEQLKHLERETFTSTALLNMLLASKETYPKSQCLNNLSTHILLRIENRNHIKVTKGVLKAYAEQRAKERSFIVDESNQFRDPYQTSSARKNEKPLHQGFIMEEYGSRLLIVIATASSSNAHSIVASHNGEMQRSTGGSGGYATRYAYFVPTDFDRLRCNLSYYKIMRAMVDWRERELQRMTKKKEKNCPILAIEAAFQAFQLIGVLTKSDHCHFFDSCLETDRQLFWSPVYSHYFSVDEAKILMCTKGISMDKWVYDYKQNYRQEYVETQVEFTAETIDLQEHVEAMDKTVFDNLINSLYMGRYLGDRIKYDLYLVIKQIFLAGLTTEQFITYNERHFFIYDATPHTLVFLIKLLDFKDPNVSTERYFNLWEQILETSRSYGRSNESHFIYAVLRVFEIEPIYRLRMNRGTVRKAIVASNPALDSQKLTLLIEKTVFV